MHPINLANEITRKYLVDCCKLLVDWDNFFLVVSSGIQSQRTSDETGEAHAALAWRQSHFWPKKRSPPVPVWFLSFRRLSKHTIYPTLNHCFSRSKFWKTASKDKLYVPGSKLCLLHIFSTRGTMSALIWLSQMTAPLMRKATLCVSYMWWC